MKHLKVYTKQDILSLTKIRRFETKVGERLHTIKDISQLEESIEKSPAKYVLLGIPEDIGVKANHGNGGTETGCLFCNLFLIYRAMIFSAATMCCSSGILILAI